jgi:oligopeptidase B
MQYADSRTLESFFACKNHLIIDGRENGFSAIWVLRFDEETSAVKECHKTEWPSENALIYPSIAGETLRCVGMNQLWDTHHIYVSYSSLVSPRTVYKYDMNSKEKVALKTTPVKGFDSSKYTTMRLEITARDGVKVPVSVAYRTDMREHKGPLLLEGYGSYGISNDPAFMRTAVPLMDRGVTIAVAHIRGGGEMGREWYEKQGKYLTKLNTFYDFIDVAEHLISTGWTQQSKLAISGRSAGGLLMGATLNMRPDLFRCVVAGVPFVDVMVSMCDPSIPLTTGEWEEWGNPNEKVYFDYMLKYAPMENIKKSDKPDVLITAGLHDPRVAYWEAAKYATRLRESVTNGARVLLKTDLSAGHFSASDRYQHFKQTAFEHAFTLECLGLAGDVKPEWARTGDK